MITGHPGLGSDPPKRVRPGKGSHIFSGIVIESGPKIEEHRVIKKEISEYASTCALIPCFLLDIDIL